MTLVLDAVKRLASEMKVALVKGQIRKLGELLNENWENKKKFAKGVSNPKLDRIYNSAINNGAIGGKISGAGGGGFMFFICEFDKKHIVADKLEHMGAEKIDFSFENHGVQTWRYLE